jgi:hypothetical protein
MLAPGAWAQSKYKVIYKFAGHGGARPHGDVIFDAARNLYGRGAGGPDGHGVVFKLTPNAAVVGPKTCFTASRAGRMDARLLRGCSSTRPEISTARQIGVAFSSAAAASSSDWPRIQTEAGAKACFMPSRVRTDTSRAPA